MNTVTAFETLNLTSIDQGCRELATILGLDDPVSPDVLISALRSEEYARNLLTCRGVPDFMNSLLENPTCTFTPALAQSAKNSDLLKSAAVALVKWSKVGFSVASDEVVEARLRACLACPDLQRRENKAMLYKILGTAAVCGLCGCDVEKKARMNSERCSGQAFDDPTKNRWGQARHTAPV